MADEIDFIRVIIERYDSEGNTYIDDHRLEGARIHEADTIDDEKAIFIVGKWLSSSSSYNSHNETFSVSDELEIWKNRTKTAEAKVDNLENLLKEKDNALEPFVKAYQKGLKKDSRGAMLGEFYDQIDMRDGEKAAEAYYLDKTEGD